MSAAASVTTASDRVAEAGLLLHGRAGAYGWMDGGDALLISYVEESRRRWFLLF